MMMMIVIVITIIITIIINNPSKLIIHCFPFVSVCSILFRFVMSFLM